MLMTRIYRKQRGSAAAAQHLHHHGHHGHHGHGGGGLRVSSNLVVQALLALCFILFVSFNIYYITKRRQILSSSSSATGSSSGNRNRVRGGPQHSFVIHDRWIDEQSQPFNLRHVANRAHHLIMVAGHSVTISGHLEDADHDERDWFLLDYQQHKGLPEAIVAHIKQGIALAQEDPDSLLIFSGGETRASTGPATEGGSYFRVADAMGLWPTTTTTDTTTSATTTKKKKNVKNSVDSTVRARTVTEEYATDSFENLMFSICRFHEVTGVYPSKISVVSFSFKQHRFESMHANAIRWPPYQFQYVGIDPPEDSTRFNLQEATVGERENAATPFTTDPYGCHSAILQQKRQQRNPFARTPPYELTCPEMKTLLHHCGPQLISKSKVPW